MAAVILMRVQKASELHHIVTEDRICEALTLTASKRSNSGVLPMDEKPPSGGALAAMDGGWAAY